MTPICPKCGSVKVSAQGTTGVCAEKDCGYVAPWKRFKEAADQPGPSYSGNQHWRDPVAMSMDGYDE
jgi:hypothetical protein